MDALFTALFMILWGGAGVVGVVHAWRKGYLRSLVRWNWIGWILFGWFVVYWAVGLMIVFGPVTLAVSYLLRTRWGYLGRR